MSRSVGKTLSTLGAFILGFVALVVIIRVLLPQPLRLYAAERSEKLAMIEANATADSAVFGSSHVHDGFDPRAFDLAMREGGVSLRTLNLGIRGGSQTEQRAMALAWFDALKAHGTRPRLVMLEISAGANLTGDHLMHPRTINLYDTATVRFATAFSKGDLPMRQKIGRVGYAVVGGLLNALNVGMASNRIFSHPLDPKIVEADNGDDRRGVSDHRDPPRSMPASSPDFDRSVAPSAAAALPIVIGDRLMVDQLASRARELFGPEGVPRFVEIAMPLDGDYNAPKGYPERLDTSVGPRADPELPGGRALSRPFSSLAVARSGPPQCGGRGAAGPLRRRRASSTRRAERLGGPSCSSLSSTSSSSSRSS